MNLRFEICYLVFLPKFIELSMTGFHNLLGVPKEAPTSPLDRLGDMVNDDMDLVWLECS